jgi:hypothetical protein
MSESSETGAGDTGAGQEGAVAVGPEAAAEPPAATGEAPVRTVAGPAPAPRYVPPPPARTWPKPARGPSRAMWAAVLTVGVAAAVAMPSGLPGLGVTITVLAGVIAVLAVEITLRRPATGLRESAGWAAATLALAAVATFRDAQWLVDLCVLAALATAALAAASRSTRSVWTSGVVAVAAAFRALPWFGSAASGRADISRLARVGVALVVGLVLLAVFVPLMASADEAFADVVDALVPTIDLGNGVQWAFFFVVGAMATAGCCLLAVAPPVARPRAERGRLRGLEWALPVGLLVALFALFVGVQAVSLFRSSAQVRDTAGLTYAEYARGGFWQLVVITVLAFGVVVLALRVAPQGTARERGWKRSLLAALAVLTLVIVASAVHRMNLYQDAYGATVLRLVVLVCEIWLGVGFVMVLVAALRLRGGGLPRAMVATGVAALLVLAWLDPEALVAEQNVARYQATGSIDTGYLAGLSGDAAPALMALPPQLRDCTVKAITDRIDADAWQSANVSRARARPLGDTVSCATRSTS